MQLATKTTSNTHTTVHTCPVSARYISGRRAQHSAQAPIRVNAILFRACRRPSHSLTASCTLLAALFSTLDTRSASAQRRPARPRATVWIMMAVLCHRLRRASRRPTNRRPLESGSIFVGSAVGGRVGTGRELLLLSGKDVSERMLSGKDMCYLSRVPPPFPPSLRHRPQEQ